MPRQLLFLIADTGGAHRTLATAVAKQLDQAWPGDFETAIVDPFASLSPGIAGRTTGLYGPLIRHAPWLWGGLWHSTNSRSMVSIVELALRTVDPGIRRLVAQLQPAAIVSFHPLLGRAAARARQQAGRPIPVVSVVTDLVDVHAFWACPDVDLMIVPSPVALDRCRRDGVPASRLVEIGLPVSPAFAAPRPEREAQRAGRLALGLDPNRFTVLVCGGADGSGGIEHRARRLAGSPLDVNLVVVCGHNRGAQRRLAGLSDRHGQRVTVLGFIGNMAEWMAASDVVVSKAGAGTIAEALCAGLPLLIAYFLPGQERGNMEWVVATGAGRYVPSDDELIRELAVLSLRGSPGLAAMRAAALRIARPRATCEVAEAIRSIAGAGQG